MKTFGNVARFALILGATVAASSFSAEAREIKVQRKAVAVATAPAEIAASAPVAWTAAPIQAAPVAAAEPAVPACARKVKVIYAGYGEANRAAPCTLASNELAK